MVGFAEARGGGEDDGLRVHVDAEALVGVQDGEGFVVDLAGAAEELCLQVGAAAVGGGAAPAVGVHEEVAVNLISNLGGKIEEGSV